MNLITIEARDLSEAWYLAVRECVDHGHIYTIERGSFVGQRRKEFDSVTINVKFPGSRPLVPSVPEGVPPPATQEYVEQYLPYLMTSDKSQGELYTYGEDIDYQLKELVNVLKEGGEGTNQACMSIGSRESIFLEHSQCLRVIDTRIRDGRLHFYVYFRSWDLWAGFPSNLAAIQILKEYVATELGVVDGELTAYSKGLHLYDHNWPLADMLLRR